jgi:hypothetical protein
MDRVPTNRIARKTGRCFPADLTSIGLTRQVYTERNSLCCNSFTGQGQLLWVGVGLYHSFGQRFSLVSMVSINLGIWFYGVGTGDTGETVEPEESQ